MSILQSASEGDLINQAATRAIDDTDTAFCLCDPCRIEEVARLLCERRVKRNEIRAGKQIVELLHQLHLQTARACGGEVGIISRHPHAESDRAAAELTANSSHSNYAKCLVVKLDAFEIFPAPLLRPQIRIRLRDFSRYTQQERKGVLRG